MLLFSNSGKEVHSMVLSAQKQKAVLTGPQLVDAFLQELSTFVQRAPGREITGTPQEIVEEVLLSTSRFGECGETCITNLSRQLAMAVNSKGRRFRLSYELLRDCQVKVAYT